MQHQYPFVVLYFKIDGHLLDVNVHPTKMELRFFDNEHIYQTLLSVLRDKLLGRDLIPKVGLDEEKKVKITSHEKQKERAPEPFEKNRLDKIVQTIQKDSPYEKKYPTYNFKESIPKAEASQSDIQPSYTPSNAANEFFTQQENKVSEEISYHKDEMNQVLQEKIPSQEQEEIQQDSKQDILTDIKQLTLADEKGSDFLREDTKARYHIIGQLFSTYWLFEFEDKLFIVDQHAAHEKVLYEKTMHALQEKEHISQRISPPLILSLSMKEEETLKKYKSEFEKLGYLIEPFGGKEYCVSAVPADMYGINEKQLFIEMLDDIEISGSKIEPELVLSKIATMSCKAAVKGNQKISQAEMQQLFDDLIELDNPYLCPHGRPTIISMSKYELEKKFKRIL